MNIAQEFAKSKLSKRAFAKKKKMPESTLRGILNRERTDGNVLFISDLHAPYHHQDSLPFLAKLNDDYEFSRIINVGDELDHHAISFHDSDPDLDSAGVELNKGRAVMHELYDMFPQMDLMESNHGSLAYRKAMHHGIPRGLILEYKDAIFGEKNKDGTIHRPDNRGDGWNWHKSLTIDNNGKRVRIVHGMSVSTRRNVEQSGMCFVQGHHHSVSELVFHGTPDVLNWGMTIGCLINDEALAFAYNKNTIKRPVIGCGAIIDGEPRLLPMNLDNNGRWTG